MQRENLLLVRYLLQICYFTSRCEITISHLSLESLDHLSLIFVQNVMVWLVRSLVEPRLARSSCPGASARSGRCRVSLVILGWQAIFCL